MNELWLMPIRFLTVWAVAVGLNADWSETEFRLITTRDSAWWCLKLKQNQKHYLKQDFPSKLIVIYYMYIYILYIIYAEVPKHPSFHHKQYTKHGRNLQTANQERGYIQVAFWAVLTEAASTAEAVHPLTRVLVSPSHQSPSLTLSSELYSHPLIRTLVSPSHQNPTLTLSSEP